MYEFPNLPGDLFSDCFWIDQSSVSFKIIGRDLMGKNPVGPWIYVEVKNNKIVAWNGHNNEKYKDQQFFSE